MSSYLRCLTNLLYPPACVLCETRAESKGGLCDPCAGELECLPVRGPRCARCRRPSPTPFETGLCSACTRVRPAFAAAASAVRYGGGARELLLRFKLGRQVHLASVLGNLLDRALGDLEPPFDAFVPVPSHPRRARARPHGPVALLAREAAARWRVPVREQWLARVVLSTPQGDPRTRSRAANVRGAFRATGVRALLAPRTPRALRIVLIDDVFTSGSTASECARVLRAAGARAVVVATVARGGLGRVLGAAQPAPGPTAPAVLASADANGLP